MNGFIGTPTMEDIRRLEELVGKLADRVAVLERHETARARCS